MIVFQTISQAEFVWYWRGCWQWQASVLHLSAQLFIALRTAKPALEIQVENFRILNWKFLKRNKNFSEHDKMEPHHNDFNFGYFCFSKCFR